MTPTEVDRLFCKYVEDQDGEACQLCTICLIWVLREEEGEHSRQKHLR